MRSDTCHVEVLRELLLPPQPSHLAYSATMSFASQPSQSTKNRAAAVSPQDDESRSTARIPMSEIGMVNKRAQMRGTVSGIAVGLLSGE